MAQKEIRQIYPQPAWVDVRVDHEPRAIHFMPPERAHASLLRADYERRAVELVRQYLVR